MSRFRLSRRAMLRSAGACLALPLLEAMLPRTASLSRSTSAQTPASTGPQPRMICCYVPNGVNHNEWAPVGTGTSWTMSRTLEVLNDYRDDFTVLTGLGHPNSKGGHFGGDTWLTGANLEGTPGKDYQNSISVDQLAAELHGRQTRLPSLELSFNGGTGAAGHSHTLAFDRTGTPLPAENSPQRVFNRLFTPDGQAAREATLRRYATQRSILDNILGEASSLSRRLGQTDRQRLDEYLSSVRQTELRVQRQERWVDIPKAVVSSSALRLNAQPNRQDIPQWLDVMLELCSLALKTDTTRVITFQWAREAGGFGERGEDHHELSHHGGDAGMLTRLAAVDRFHLGKLGRFLGLLKSSREADGNMLDNTLVLYGSGMNSGEGGGHSPKNVPLLLAGGRRLGLRHGSHLRFAVDSTPLSNVLLTMLNAVGVERQSFMDSTGSVNGLV